MQTQASMDVAAREVLPCQSLNYSGASWLCWKSEPTSEVALKK